MQNGSLCSGQGRSPFVEPGIGELLERGRALGLLAFHADPADALPRAALISCASTRTTAPMDRRNFFDPDVVRAAGFTYVGVGRAQADTPAMRIAAASVG